MKVKRKTMEEMTINEMVGEIESSLLESEVEYEFVNQVHIEELEVRRLLEKDEPIPIPLRFFKRPPILWG